MLPRGRPWLAVESIAAEPCADQQASAAPHLPISCLTHLSGMKASGPLFQSVTCEGSRGLCALVWAPPGACSSGRTCLQLLGWCTRVSGSFMRQDVWVCNSNTCTCAQKFLPSAHRHSRQRALAPTHTCTRELLAPVRMKPARLVPRPVCRAVTPRLACVQFGGQEGASQYEGRSSGRKI